MKNLKFNLSDNDIEAITCALKVMPSYGFELTEAEANSVYVRCDWIAKKLMIHEPLTSSDTAFIAFAVDNAFKALRGEIIIDDESVISLRPYFFTINKLQPVFSPYLDGIF